MPTNNNPAPGHPGHPARWASSAKSGIGKPLSASSDIAFSISHGILNEIYYPREDIPCIRDLEFLVTDGDQFFSEEKRHTRHKTKAVGDGIPAYTIINTCLQYKYQLSKEIIADPLRSTLLQKISFQSDGNSSYHLYVQLAPHLNNQGDHNSGWCGSYKGTPMLFAEGNGLALAMVCSTRWHKCSVGFVGISDGWTDLNRHKHMTWEYTQASDGNIALTGEIDIPSSGEFVVALGFGRSWQEAANHAWGSILEGFDSARDRYLKGWEDWFKTLLPLKGDNFRISAAVLRINEAKNFPGAVLASLSIPWGESKGDNDKGGYHLVWPRDLVETAGGFLALGTKDDALRIVNYLLSTQREDGGWPQNMWLEGSSYWNGHQKDQTALPVLLLAKCYEHQALDTGRMTRYWPIIQRAIHHLLLTGPYTDQDRWEEEKGYSPFTLATVIAGLLAAADIAALHHQQELADYCRETADYWNDQIEYWTYVTDTPLARQQGVDGYYIRINPYHHLASADLADHTIDLKNHTGDAGKTLLNELVSVDALALVRFGLRDARDPKILNTVKVIDALLKTETPSGPCWHRYNNDGYGEDAAGNAYNGAGVGRAWPLLTGERAHYEIALGNIAEAERLLKAIDAFANHGMISEQIWDTDSLPEKELFFGKHSGSGMPLTWAHAEYIKLCVSIRDKDIFDMPRQTRSRYIDKKVVSRYQVWRFSAPRHHLPAGKILRIEVLAEAMVHWTDDGWNTIHQTPAKDKGMGIYVADLETVTDHSSLIFTFHWKEADRWEGRNFAVEKLSPVIEETPANPSVVHSA